MHSEDTQIRAYAEQVQMLQRRVEDSRHELTYARQLLGQIRGLLVDRCSERDAAGAPVFLMHMPSGLYNCILDESRK